MDNTLRKLFGIKYDLGMYIFAILFITACAPAKAGGPSKMSILCAGETKYWKDGYQKEPSNRFNSKLWIYIDLKRESFDSPGFKNNIQLELKSSAEYDAIKNTPSSAQILIGSWSSDHLNVQPTSMNSDLNSSRKRSFIFDRIDQSIRFWYSDAYDYSDNNKSENRVVIFDGTCEINKNI